jgi:signal transducing adaptor molecule
MPLTGGSWYAAKATDENLTSEDWGAIMELCDRVASDQNGPKEAVQSMIKRLAHRNANVQLYTLEVSPPLHKPRVIIEVSTC